MQNKTPGQGSAEVGSADLRAVVRPVPSQEPHHELLRRYYPEVEIGGFTAVNGTVAFYERVNMLLLPEHVLLDVGCGRGAWLESPSVVNDKLRNFRGRCRQVIGIDVDAAGEANASLDQFERISSPTWPIDDASVDIIVCDYVMEHVEDVDGFFGEAHRVLRPGGYLCIRTPNKWFYVSVISRLVPNRLHAKLVGKAQGTRQEQDVFRTLYRCNTGRAILRAFRRHGLEGAVIAHEPEPLYLTFNRFAFWLGVMHQRLAPRPFKANLFGFARKAG